MTSTAPHQAIYRRWRAQTFAQIVGQEAVVETLRNAVRTDRVAHGLLFVGPRGTGKTSLARIVAKALNCTNLSDGDPCDACASCVAIREGRTMDLVEIDAASTRGIDAIRDLRERINYAPAELRRKVYILDEAHQITKDAWNALLKSLEEPPDFVVFMFASTHPQEFPPAILSRLQRFDVRRLSVPEIEGKLRRILEADNRTAEPGAIHLIARMAAGGMRDAESMLDQLLASGGDGLDEGRVRDLLGLADEESVAGFVAALVNGDAASGIPILDVLEDRGRDLRVFLDQVVEALRLRLVAALSGRSTEGPSAARLAAAARRLAAIDPSRAGVGGLRLQLELALFGGAADVPAAPVVATTGAPAPAATPTRVPAASPPAASRAAAAPRAEAAKPAATEERATTSTDATEGAPAKPARRSKPAAGSAAKAPPADPARESATAAAAAAAPAPAPDVAATAAGGDDLATLLAGWPALVGSTTPATRAVISECRPLSVEGNVVVLGFPESKGFLKDHAERKRPDIEAAVGRLLGRAVAVRSVATNIDVAPLGADGDAAYVLAEARRIFADDLVDVGEVS
ncbi:MAG TPA: DNA polymerase III subunit gamma/tau [Candidatus Limnocylindrales bacterium]